MARDASKSKSTRDWSKEGRKPGNGYVPDNRDNRMPICRSLDSDTSLTQPIVLELTNGNSRCLFHQPKVLQMLHHGLVIGQSLLYRLCQRK